MQRAKSSVFRLIRENRQTTINLILNCEMIRQNLINGNTERIMAHSHTRTTVNLEGNRDLKQPGRVCGRRREKTSEVWVENVVQSSKNKCLSKLPSRLVAEVGRQGRIQDLF